MFSRRPSLLSVVVPAYDVAAYLPACLDSVLAQSETLGKTGLEVVVVDDGSPDESGEIAESYAARDSRVRVVHTENQGLGAARNEGLRHVTGDLLAFADSDDVVPPGSYATLLHQLTRTGSDFVTGSVARWESGRRARPGRAALDEAAAPAADGPRHRRPAGDPRRRVRVEQAVPHRLLALDRALVARGGALRGPADHHAGLPARPAVRDRPRGRLPLADPLGRHLDHPAALLDAGPARPLGDQADLAAQRRGVRRPEGHLGLPRPGARRRPAPLLRGDPGLRRRVVGAAPHRRPLHLGLPLAHPQRPAARRPAGRLAGRAGPSRGRRRGGGLRPRPRPARWTASRRPDGRRLDVPVLDLSTVAPQALALRDTER